MNRHLPLRLSTITQDDLPEDYIAGIRDVLARVQRGPRRDRWPGGEGAPELIVLLLRAAPIPFAAIRGCAAAHGIPLPPVVEAHIGSELYMRFKRERGMGTGYSFMLLDDAEREDYNAWLDADRYAQSVVAHMKRDAAQAGVSHPTRIMIYDDFECEGGTLFTAQSLTRQAFPEAEIEVSVLTVESTQIVSRLLPRLPLSKQAARHACAFLYDLAKGYRETPSGLDALDSPLKLQRLGQQDRHRKWKAYAILAELYGDAQLLAFPRRVRHALQNLGQTIDPTPPPPPKRVWLLTGPHGIGKTTVLQKTLALLLQTDDDKAGPDGFVTVPNKEASGYDLLSLGGKRVTLAATSENNFADPTTVTLPDGRAVTVDRAAIEEMIGETLSMALLGQAVVIDEIGPLLLASDHFSDHLWWLLEHGGGTILATVTPGSHPFIDRIKAHPVVERIEVTKENRDALPEQLTVQLDGKMHGSGLLLQLQQ